MDIKNLNKYINNADQTVFWLDLLKLNLKQKIIFLSDILSTVDFDNSNMLGREFWWFDVSFIKIMTPNWPAINISLSVDNVPYTLFQYLEYDDKRKKMFNSEWALTFYWTYYRLLEIKKLSYSFEMEFFWWEFESIKLSPISRVDYKIDFCYKDPTVIIPLDDVVDYRSNYKSTKYSLTSDEYQKHWDLMWNKLNAGNSIEYQAKSVFAKWDFQTGWNIWSKWNKSVYGRCYEKLVDTIAKWKVKLYNDYFLFSNVFRLEFEFRIRFNKDDNGNTYTYQDISELEHKIHRYLWLTDWVKSEKFVYQYRENNETDFSEVGRYQKDFWGRWYWLLKQWFNPFIVLIIFLRKKKLDFEIINDLVSDFFSSFNSFYWKKM